MTLDFHRQFSINPQISNFTKIRPVGDPRGRTDMTKITVAFRNSATAPENATIITGLQAEILNPEPPEYEAFQCALHDHPYYHVCPDILSPVGETAVVDRITHSLSYILFLLLVLFTNFILNIK
jgi:hypothetical protein